MRVTYLGQACLLIEGADRKILTDPWLTEGAYFGTWFHTHVLADAGITPVTFAPSVDYIFISHEHQDHLDPASLRCFPPDIPILICRFATPRLRQYLEGLGRKVCELPSGQPLNLGGGLQVTIFGSAEYTNDAAILVEAEGFTVFNETDCKLGYEDLRSIGERRIDIGFYMFSGANWYPMMYDFPEPLMTDLIQHRRKGLLRSLVQRVKVTRPGIAVPAAGPCTVLDPERLWLNSAERGIFIDPEVAIAALESAGLASEPVYMAATDVWDSQTGIERLAPPEFRMPRDEYIRNAAVRMAPLIRAIHAAEPPAAPDLAAKLMTYFESVTEALIPSLRQRISAKLALEILGPNGGDWTVDFLAPTPPYVREGLSPDWTYKITVEDKLIYPFLSGSDPFFENILLSLRAGFARRPNEYNEPLYHFLYEPDPKKLQNWYGTH